MFTIRCDHFKHPGGLFGTFIDVPINPISYPLLSHFTHHNAGHGLFCKTLLYNFTKSVYYSRHIPGIRARRHQIPDMFHSEINIK